MNQTNFATELLSWYARHARDLPWRANPDPYPVWVSEIMLQQTRVETVIPYFKRWMKRFPTISDLGKASQQEVLSLWEGLGYYSRARNLLRAAQIVIAEHGGELPRQPQALMKLPGIGRYTAGAIASIAYGFDEPALDGNIRRVLARAFNVEAPARSSNGERRLWELAAEHLPTGRAGEYNQALMDLGATVCTPGEPDCERCPLAGLCLARRLGIQEQRPVRLNKPPIPHHTVTAAIITRGARVLIAQRPADGLLGGLWEFPGGKLDDGEDLVDCLQREILEELGARIKVEIPLGVYQHAYTHYRVTLHAFCCTLTNGDQPRPLNADDLRWVTPAELSGYPMGKIDRQISNDLLSNEATLC